jgi:hypothetical protein
MPDINREKETEDKWAKAWEKTWKPLIYTDGKLDEQKIKNEMHDLWFIYEQVSLIYSELTGGMLSKPMYYADQIIGFHDQKIEDSYNEGYEDGKAEFIPPQESTK